MPDRDLAAQLRAYIDGAAEPVQPDEVVGDRRRRPDAAVRASAVAAVFAAAAVAVAFVVITRHGDVEQTASPPRKTRATEVSTFPSIPPVTTATVFPGAGLWPHVTHSIHVGGDPQGIAEVGGIVWVALDGGVVAVDADTGTVTARHRVPAETIDFDADRSGL